MRILVFTLFVLSFFSCKQNKTTPTNNMLTITDTTEFIDLHIGEQASYQALEHGSVGIKVELLISNSSVLKIDKQKKEYAHPNNKKMPGGDQVTKTFILQAIDEGMATIQIRKLFRGALQKEQTIKCIVTKK